MTEKQQASEKEDFLHDTTDECESKNSEQTSKVEEENVSSKTKDEEAIREKLETIRKIREFERIFISSTKSTWVDKVFDYIIFPITIIGFVLAISLSYFDNEKYINKVDTQNKISKLIDNSAELETIKYYLENSVEISDLGISQIFDDKKDHYPKTVSLKQVLMDIKSELYLSEDVNLEKVRSLNELILLNEQQNPFYGLEENQTDLFENVLIKSGDNYRNIQLEMNKLANELRMKNVQIKETDSQNQTSYYITILSFISALAIAFFQIFQSRPKKTKELFVNALKESGFASEKEKSQKK